MFDSLSQILWINIVFNLLMAYIKVWSISSRYLIIIKNRKEKCTDC